MIPQGNTALIDACQKEDISSVHSLNKLGADTNICNKVTHSTGCAYCHILYAYLDMCSVCVAYLAVHCIIHPLAGGSDSSADSCEEGKCGPGQRTAGSWC